MKIWGGVLLALILAVSSGAAQAQEPGGGNAEMAALFKDRFKSDYVPGRCGDNVLRLVAAARDAGIKLEDSKVLFIQNSGGSVFGMLNVELARDSEPGRKPSERNWYHHVVLVHDGKVYDFDFLNEPTVETTARYFERMFLDENPKPTDSYGFYVGRKYKLAEYQVEAIDALEYVKARQANEKPKRAPAVSFKDYLEPAGK